MALNAEMVLRASLFRTESRGLHYREDYPFRDDENWLAWTVLKEEDGQMKLHKKPVPEEWRPDSSMSYEEKYDFRFLNEIIK
jgi:succinate dehydrogenase/fumarate reductase flavoprotein subunit